MGIFTRQKSALPITDIITPIAYNTQLLHIYYDLLHLHWKKISIKSRKYWSKYEQSNIFLTQIIFSCLKKMHLIPENQVSLFKSNLLR